MAYVADPARFTRAFQALDTLERESARLRQTLDVSRAIELKSTWFPERRAGDERREGGERRSSDRRSAGPSERN